MSVISLFYGQCGNQISESLFSNIYEDINNCNKDTEYYPQALTKWFNVTKTNKWEPRSILIDTECKTVQHKRHGLYQFKNVVTKSCGGSANNWAFGYFEQSKLLTEEILECARKELEKCDYFGSFLNVFSSSGGTGSGVGSFMTESLKDEFPVESAWTVADKKKLLMALQKCATKDIAAIQKLVPEKTITEVRYAVEKYSRLAASGLQEESKLKEEDSAINQWIEIVRKTQVKSNGVFDIIPRVLKYIALFEKRPPDADVNLKDCYMALSQMSKGLLSTNLTSSSGDFFYENLSKLALRIRNEDTTRQKLFIRGVNNLDHIFKKEIIKTYIRKQKRVNVILNPLNVPDHLLKIPAEKADSNI